MSPVRVLVVDDFEPFRRLIHTILPSSSFEIIGQASDGLEAVQKSADLQPDLILLDIGLPKLNGIEAAKRIRKVAPHSEILFVSKETDPEVVEVVLGLGVLGYVSKDCMRRDLLPAIESVQRFVASGLAETIEKGKAQLNNKPLPYRFEFDPTNSILQGSFEGFVSKQDVRNYYQTAVNHVAQLSPHTYVIDVSAVTSTTASTGTILELTKLPPVLPNPTQPGFIVAARPAAYWLMRIYQAAARATRPNLHVVRKHTEAWEILGVVEPRFEPLLDGLNGEDPSFNS